LPLRKINPIMTRKYYGNITIPILPNLSTRENVTLVFNGTNVLGGKAYKHKINIYNSGKSLFKFETGFF